MDRLCFSTYVVDMKECDAPESNSITAEELLTRNILMTTSGASWASSTTTWLTTIGIHFAHLLRWKQITGSG
jgi:hypothetical protein